jgi:MFS family permease
MSHNIETGIPPSSATERGGTMASNGGTSMVKVALASLVGTAIEFYDFLIYSAAAALVFSQIFFPALGESAGTTASFATLGVAFIARPIGAIIFGHVGDRLGRKRTLITTVLLMGLATICIGLLPTATTIGVAAPVILVVLRFCQGLAAGGEWAGAVLFTSEHAPKDKRGFWSMFTQLGASIANILALSTFLIIDMTMSEDSFLSYGWRIPFLISAVLLVYGLWIRLRMTETPVFEHEKATRADTRAPFVEACRRQWREILLGTGALLMPFALGYMGTVYLINYGKTSLDLDSTTVLAAGAAGIVTQAAGILAGGILSDRIGRRKMLLTANALGIACSLVLFPLVDTGSFVSFQAGILISTLIAGFGYGVAPAFLSELYETRYRYTATALAYNLAALFGGAFPTVVAAGLTAAFGSYAVSLLLAALCLIGVICTLVLQETRQRDLADITAPAAAVAST